MQNYGLCTARFLGQRENTVCFCRSKKSASFLTRKKASNRNWRLAERKTATKLLCANAATTAADSAPTSASPSARARASGAAGVAVAAAAGATARPRGGGDGNCDATAIR